MMRVFLDTNILLDVIVPDRPSASSSSMVFEQVRKGELEAYIVTQSIIDMYYISSQFNVKKEEADRLTQWLLAYINICSVDSFDIRAGLRMESSDFEDNTLISHAKAEECDIFVTNDRRILSRGNLSPMKVMRPELFVETMKLS